MRSVEMNYLELDCTPVEAALVGSVSLKVCALMYSLFINSTKQVLLEYWPYFYMC